MVRTGEVIENLTSAAGDGWSPRRTEGRDPRSIATVLAFALGLLALMAAACGQSSEPQGNVGRGSATGDAVEVVIDDGRFETDTLELTAGREVTVEVRNEDGGPHDFAIDALDLNTGTIEPGEVATATFTVPEGTTEFVCTFHGGMSGVIKT